MLLGVERVGGVLRGERSLRRSMACLCASTPDPILGFGVCDSDCDFCDCLLLSFCWRVFLLFFHYIYFFSAPLRKVFMHLIKKQNKKKLLLFSFVSDYPIIIFVCLALIRDLI